MRTVHTAAVVLVSAGLFLGLLTTSAQAERRKITLNGFDEVPVIITKATGELVVRIDDVNQTIDYTVSWENLEGGNVRQAHIHLGQQHVTGPIVLFLCTNLGNAPASPPAPATPACPAGPNGTVSGTLTPASIVPAATQGVGANDLDAVIEAIRQGVAYGNVHTDVYQSGEIRRNFRGKH